MSKNKPTYEELVIRVQELEQANSELESIKTPLYNDAGQMLGTLCVGQDIPEHKLAANKLEHIRYEYESILANLQGISYRCLYDKEWTMTYMSPHVDQLTGYPPSDFIHNSVRTYESIIHREDTDAVDHAVNAGIKHNKPWEIEYRICHKDGMIRWVYERGSGVADRDGKIKYLDGFIVDISAKKESEKALKESEARYRQMFEHAGFAITLINANTGERIAFNHEAYEQLGYKQEEYLKLQPFEIEAGKSPEDVITDYKRVVRKGADIFATQHKANNGEIRDVLISSVAININGEDFINNISMDITDRKKLEAQLIQAQKMESIGTLAGGIAHDFNNILSPIMIYTELAMLEFPSDHPVKNSLRQVYKAGERARDLVKHILTFARKSDGERIPTKVSLTVKESIKFIRSTIPSSIDIQYSPNTKSDTVIADPIQLNQVVMNLCTNAAHAMEQNGGILEVVIENETIQTGLATPFTELQQGQYLKLSVKDTGSGIKPHLISKIFEPYFTTKDRGKGTGMGLALVHGIVKSYGGDITVDSTLGKGTCFTIYLPLAHGDDNYIDTKTELTTYPGGHERILFVDDEKTMVDLMQSMLESLGYNVTAFTSSIDALKIFREKPQEFDLVITDQTMPKMTGDELADKIFEIRSDIQIILCTGFSDRINEQQAKTMGINAFIMKPISMETFAKTIRDCFTMKNSTV